MDTINNRKILISEKISDKAGDILSSNVKSEINDCETFSKNVDDKNIVRSNYIKMECMKEEEGWENQGNMKFEPSILHESINIKEEKVEANYDSFSDEQTDAEHNAIEKIEFVEVKNIKIEEIDKYDEGDPIKLNKGIFSCYYCKGAFTTPKYHQMHEIRCKNNNYKQKTPTADPLIITDSPNQQKHEKTTIKLYQCNKCTDKFQTKCGLRNHIRRHNVIDFSCKKQFTTSSHLDANIITNSAEKSNKCVQNQKVFNQENLKTHSGMKLYNCTQCEMSFTCLMNFTIHRKRHIGKPYKCSICSQTYSYSYTLTEHMKTHNKPFKCDQCPKTFSHSNLLAKHTRFHSEARPYICSICDKNFTKSYHLTIHMRTHTGEKPFKCKYCEKAFIRSSNLMTHIVTHIGDKKYKCVK